MRTGNVVFMFITLMFLVLTVVGLKQVGLKQKGTREQALIDSVRTLNTIIEMDIKTIRAQNDTNLTLIDSISYWRNRENNLRTSLFQCWRTLNENEEKQNEFTRTN